MREDIGGFAVKIGPACEAEIGGLAFGAVPGEDMLVVLMPGRNLIVA